jgi:hypothetical protein
MPARAQLLSEQADGLHRVCTYAGTANVTSEERTRIYRIGIGQNCPLNYPAPGKREFPPPPTAELRGEQLTATGRACIYEQAGTSWPIELPSSQACPLFAGSAAAEQGFAGSADSWPSGLGEPSPNR